MDEAFIKKVLPHSSEAEQSVIGSMIMDKDAIVTASEMVTGDDFYEQRYSVLFDAMIELFNEGKPVDLITLSNKLKEKDVQFVSLKENIDTTTPTGVFMLTVFGAVAQLERDYLKERQAEGIAVAKEQGKYKGRKPIEYPKQWEKYYKMVKNGDIKAVDAMKLLDLKKTTFYKLIQQYELK